MKDKFPIYEIINYKGNRYELVRACSLRAFHLILKRKEDSKDKETGETSSNRYNYKKDIKIHAAAMSDILKNKIHFYNGDKENNK